MEQSIKPVYKHSLATALIAAQICFLAPFAGMLFRFLAGKQVSLSQEVIPEVIMFGILDVIYVVWLLARRLTCIAICCETLKVSRVLGRSVVADFRDVILRNRSLVISKRYTANLEDMLNAEAVRDLLAGHVKEANSGRRYWAVLPYGLLLIMVLFVVCLALGIIRIDNAQWALWAFIGLFAAFSTGLLASAIRNLLAK